MPRRPCGGVGGVLYHVFNRAIRGLTLFEKTLDYEAFEVAMAEALSLRPMRILHYTVMPNHWHFVMWPREDRQLSAFMHWLELTHTKRYHAAHETTGTGHIYQGPFKAFPIEEDEHYLTVARYVERNPMRKQLVERAEQWRWGSLWRRVHGGSAANDILTDGPLAPVHGWADWVNDPQTERDLEEVRLCLRRGRPYGAQAWQQSVAKRIGLESTLRPRGRPRSA